MLRGPGVTLPFSEAMLRRYAGERSFDRGWEYYVRGRVLEVTAEAGVVRGRVAGSGDAVYAVELTRRAEALQWRCDCPVGQRGDLCKHVVAAALAALHGQEGDEGNGGSPLRTYLESLDHGALVDLLLEQAGRDEALATRLEGAALAEPETDADRLRLFVAEALDPGRFIGWEDVSDYLDEAEAVEPLLERVGSRDPALAGDLAARALRAGFSGLDWVDDSGGEMGELLVRVGEHLAQALHASGTAGAELAETLFPLLRDQPFNVLRVERFRGDLGEPGLRRLEERAAEERKAPGGAAGEPDHRELQEIQPAVPGAHLRIARALAEAGRGEEAIEWAEAGLPKKAGEWPDRRLVEWLVAAYGRSGRHRQALDLAWDHFVRAPQLAGYQVLNRAAEAAGEVEDWRGRALDWLREQAGGELSGQRA
ncbi:MAG: SWIM zinc finger domain-containing protein, partial [Gemmatimonadota bacterium]